MRIAVCDDDPQEQVQFLNALWGWDPSRVAERFSTGAALLEAARMSPPFSIVFLDIYLPGEDGMEVARELRKISPDTGLVFVTTSKEHAVQAFSLDALHYLVKPVTTEEITEAFRRLSQLRTKRRATLTLTVGRESHAIYQDEIMYLQSLNHAVEVALVGGRVLKVWSPLGELERKLEGSFLKINRGTIANMEHIQQMGIDTCTMRDGVRLVLTVRDRKAIRAAYNDYLFSQLSNK